MKMSTQHQDKQGKTEQNRVVLAFGEVTGHAHAFYEPEKVELRQSKDIEETILFIKETASLTHEEHKTHVFEPGQAEVIIQSEYQMGEIKKVLD